MINFLWHVVGIVVILGIGVGFSTKIKDWIKGIPAEARAELQKAENAIRLKFAAK